MIDTYPKSVKLPGCSCSDAANGMVIIKAALHRSHKHFIGVSKS